MLKTKAIYAKKSDSDGHRILITRFYPRGVKNDHFDEWCRELSPSAGLLKQYKNAHISEKEFVRLYKAEINTDACRKIITNLHEKSTNENVTILCYEQEGKMCHRHYLSEIIHDMQKLYIEFIPDYRD